MREALPVVRTIMLALVVLGATRGARATNLIVNGTFDTDVSSWTASPGNTIAFDPIDEADSAHSGSVKITDNVDAFRDASAIQCVPIDPSVHYLFRASYYFPQGQVPGAVDVFFVGFDSSDCSGSQNSTNVTLEDGLLPAQQWKGIESGKE